MRILVGILIAVSLTLPGVAAADDGPVSRVWSIVQNGQDIEVELAVTDLSAPHTLERKSSEVVKSVVEEKTYSEADTGDEYEICKTQSPGMKENCAAKPEDCFACNDAGVPDCSDSCVNTFFFVETDQCVPPGEVTYALWNAYFPSSMNIIVEDTGDPCLDDDDNGSSDSCSVTTVGRGLAPHVLALIMLAIGLVAARVGGKK